MRDFPFALSSRLLMPALAVIVCLPSVALAAPLPPALQSRYAALLDAARACDIKTFSTFMAPNYVSVDPSGKTSTRAEYLAGIQGLMKGAKTMEFQMRYTGVKSSHGIVSVSFDGTGQLAKSDGLTTFHEVGTDSWEKRGKTWMQIKTVDKVFAVTVTKSTVPKPQ